jgi:hypothetical protein
VAGGTPFSCPTRRLGVSSIALLKVPRCSLVEQSAGTMLGFFLLIIWFWLLIVVFSDIFRSRDLGGAAKTLWVIFVIILPFLGVSST